METEWDPAKNEANKAQHGLDFADFNGFDAEPVVVEDDPISAELWEIAENLHRYDLTKEQRDRHIRRYAELLEERGRQPQQTAAPVLSDGRRSGPQHSKGVPRQIAEETGLSVDTVRRALNPQPKPAPRPQLVEAKDAYDVIGE